MPEQDKPPKIYWEYEGVVYGDPVAYHIVSGIPDDRGESMVQISRRGVS